MRAIPRRTFLWLRRAVRPPGASTWRRGLTVTLIVAAAALVAGGLAQVRVDTRIESFLPSGDPAYQALEDRARSFGGDPVVVLMESKQPRDLLMNEEKLGNLLALEGRLSKLDGVAAVYGPATVLNQTAGAAQNVLAQISGRRDALRNAEIQGAKQHGANDAQAAAAGEAAVANFDRRYAPLLVQGLPAGLPTLRNPQFVATVLYDKAGQPRPQWHFVLPNDHTAAVLVRPRENLDQAAAGRLTDAVRSTVDQSGVRADKTTVTGVPAVTSALTERAQRELPVLGAAAVAAVGLIFLLVPWSRRRRSRLRPLAAALLGTASTVAAFGWLHHPLSLGVVAFLPILLGIGSDFPFYLAQPGHRRRVLVAALAGVVGFASLLLSPLPFVQELGLALAVGILVTAGVALLLRRAFGVVEPAEPRSGRSPEANAPLLARHKRFAVLAAAVAVAGLGWVALPQLNIEARPDELARGLPELDQARYAEDVLGSSGEVSIMLRGHNVVSPEALRWTKETEDMVIRAHGDQIHPVITTSDLLRFLDSDATPEQISSGMRLLPPYLTSAVIRPDQTAAQMVFGVELQDLDQQRDLLAKVRAALPPPPAGTQVDLVGLPVSAVRGLDLVSGSRVLLNLVGILAAGAVLVIGLRSRRDAGRAVLTILLATGWVLALAWGTTGTLSPLTVAIGSLATATGCEFAVMLTDPGRAHRRWLRRSVATAALAGSTGYLVVGLSGLSVLREFGLLLAASVALSYLAALVVVRVLPPPQRESADDVTADTSTLTARKGVRV